MNKRLKDKELLVYRGSCFTIEWYYSPSGKSKAFDYYQKLAPAQRRKFLMLTKRLADSGKIYDETKFRNEGNKIYAFKPKPDRFLYFFIKGNKVIITNAFKKKTNKLPDKEKKKAISFMKSYKQRINKGEYYE